LLEVGVQCSSRLHYLRKGPPWCFGFRRTVSSLLITRRRFPRGYVMRQFRVSTNGSNMVQQFALEDRSGVARGKACPLRSISSPRHRAASPALAVVRGGAIRAGCRPPAPHGWRSLSRSSPTSRVPCRPHGHRLFGSESERQLPAPSDRLSPSVARFTCEHRAPARPRCLGASRAWAGRVPSCRSRANADAFTGTRRRRV
jgi:hypothetical protein